MTSLLDRAYPDHPGFGESPFTPDMIAQMATISGPLLSPDGSHVAYTRDYNRRADMWVMPADGGQARLVTADAPAITVGSNAPFSGAFGGGFAWTRDGSALIYTSSRDGKLYRVSRDGGRAERLSDGAGSNVGPRLSPDESLLAYTVDRGDVDDQIFVAVQDLSAPSPSVRRLTPDSVVALDPRFSPDGTRVACVLFPLHDRWAHEAEIAVIDLASGRVDVLTPTDNVVNAMPRWSPDGSTLAFISDRDGYLNLYTMPAGGGSPVSLVREACEHTQLVWSPDGRSIAYLRNECADVQVMVVDVGSGSTRRVSTKPGVYSAVSWTPDGARLCALHQSPVQAPSVELLSVEGGAPCRLASSAPGGLDDPDLFVMPEHVTWQSADGLEVPGLLLTPKKVVPNGHPVLVHVHGGPTSHSLQTWDPMAQYFVSRGWAMIKPNYRGSMGYGRKFTDLLHGEWGKGDLADNVTSVDALRERGLVDERRLAVWGSSAGGYATLCAMTMAPGVFKAGVELAGLSDLLSFPGTSDRYGRDLPQSELGSSRDNYELWVERSPVTHVANVRDPLLILQGDLDRRVPPSQSSLMVEALQKAGKVVEHHVYEGEGHGLRKCDSVRDYITRMEDFLTRHVLMR